MTQNDILQILYNDNWFTPSKSEEQIVMVDSNGNNINVAKSYYHIFSNYEQIWIRVSDHGTSLETWVRRNADPSKSIQNLSVVFSNNPVTSNYVTTPIQTVDSNGNVVTLDLYFVVEQYVYKTENLSKKDFLKFIKKIKALDGKNVFKDPFKKKPSKKATRKVLTPQASDGSVIPSTNNPVHPRQEIVANNKDYEVDADGNIIRDSRIREKDLEKIVNEVIKVAKKRILNEHYMQKRYSFTI